MALYVKNRLLRPKTGDILIFVDRKAVLWYYDIQEFSTLRRILFAYRQPNFKE